MIGGDVADQGSSIDIGPDISILTLKKTLDLSTTRAAASSCFDYKTYKCQYYVKKYGKAFCKRRKHRKYAKKTCRETCKFCKSSKPGNSKICKDNVDPKEC